MQVLTSTKGQRGLPRWFAPTFQITKKFRYGAIEFALPDGRVFAVKGSAPGPVGRADVRDVRMFARIMREGKLGFAESYLDGWFDSPDLQALLDAIYLNNREITPSLTVAALARRYEQMRHWLNRNTRKQARKNISAHYDLGNDFYSLWLDETMTYSSALFEGDESLERAQKAKYAAICDGIGVKQGDSLLEIGCGWGGFAEYAASVHGVRVRGLTISKQQHDFAKKRMFEAGLNERVEIVMQDYRDEAGMFDGIASVEMFEAVGERYWPTYFEVLRARLKPGGRATLQVITMEESLWETYRKNVDFIQKYIFPGGMLPSPTALKTVIENAGLKVVGAIEFGESYSKTLRLWNARFQTQWPQVAALGFDGRFKRMWEFYLTSCAAGFAGKSIDVTQVSVQH